MKSQENVQIIRKMCQIADKAYNSRGILCQRSSNELCINEVITSITPVHPDKYDSDYHIQTNNIVTEYP